MRLQRGLQGHRNLNPRGFHWLWILKIGPANLSHFWKWQLQCPCPGETFCIWAPTGLQSTSWNQGWGTHAPRQDVLSDKLFPVLFWAEEAAPCSVLISIFPSRGCELSKTGSLMAADSSPLLRHRQKCSLTFNSSLLHWELRWYCYLRNTKFIHLN